MKKLLILVVVFWFSFQGYACKCVSYRHLIDTSKKSKYIVIGHLVELTKVDSTLSPTSIIGLKGKLVVSESIKGKIEQDTIEIKGGYGPDCLYNLNELKINRQYLILLQSNLELDRCGYTLFPIHDGKIIGRISKKRNQEMEIEQVIQKIKKSNKS